MPDITSYDSIRAEIVINHILMHAITVVVAVTILAATAYVESRVSVISVLAPLLTLAWAAAMVRFDFFIHRQGAYLRHLEVAAGRPGWEQWHESSRWTPVIVPVMDVIGVLSIIVPTLYLLWGPAQTYFEARSLRGSRVYAWGVALGIVILLLSLTTIPRLASSIRER